MARGALAAPGKGRDRWLVLGLLALSYLLVFSQRTGPGLITDQLQQQFHVSAAVLGTMTSVQYFLYMLLQVPVGLTGDRLSPERLFAVGVILDGIGTVIFSQAHSFPMLVCGRAVVGLGDSFIWINIVLILGKRFTAAQFGGLLGIIGTSGNIGALMTTLPFAAWLAAAGWRMPFLTLGLVLVAVSMADYVIMTGWRPGRRRSHRTDPGINAGNSQIHLEHVPVWHTLRTVVRARVSWATFGCHFGIVGTYMGFVSIWAVPYFMATYHLSRSGASTFALVAFAGAICGGPIAGAVSDRLKRRKLPYVVVQVLTWLSWTALYLSFGHAPMALAYATMFLIGFGTGASLLTFAYIRDVTPMEKSGVTSGFANTGGFLSAVLLPVLFGLVVDHAARRNPTAGSASPHALAAGLLVPVVFSLVGVLGSLWLVEHRQPSSDGQPASIAPP